jgi:tetratricopeptide (TPR) repeat protein
LGLVEASLQQTGEARGQFEKSVELQPQQTESYFQLALLDLDTGDLDSAAMRFQRVLQQNPNHAGALTGMGHVEFARKNYEHTAKLLEHATQIDPSILQAHYYLGMTYGRLGRKEDAQKELETASQLEKEELNRYKLVLKLLDPDEVIKAEPDLKK